MIVNFRACKISRGARKLAQTSTLLKNQLSAKVRYYYVILVDAKFVITGWVEEWAGKYLISFRVKVGFLSQPFFQSSTVSANDILHFLSLHSTLLDL
jgi:hypothetical protein